MTRVMYSCIKSRLLHYFPVAADAGAAAAASADVSSWCAAN
jgi:hypothetical protein